MSPRVLKSKSFKEDLYELLAVIYFFTLTIQSIILSIILIITPKSLPFFLIYILYIIFDQTHSNGGRKIDWISNHRVWELLGSYFSAKLVKEEELDPKKNYVIGYHPHGVISTAGFITFGPNVFKGDKGFPGLDIRVTTADILYKIPFYRDLSLALGCISASKKSISKKLNEGPGHSCVIIVGGAKESLLSNPNTANLILNEKYGFISIAIKNGSSLVPSYGFGENEMFNIYNPKEGSLGYKIQQFMIKILGFTVPFYYGRGIFKNIIGFLPLQTPVTVVTGKPIDLEKDENPTKEKIQKIHQVYKDSLLDLYNRRKHEFSNINNPPDMNIF